MNKKNKGKVTKWIIIVVPVVAICAVVAVLFGKFSSGPVSTTASLATYTVQRGDLQISVTESGNLKALKTEDLRCQVEGRNTIIFIVPEGTMITEEDVANGKILVELDSSELVERVTQREVSFLSAEADYAQSKEAYEIQKKQNESDISAADLKLRFALMDLKKYLGESVVSDYLSELIESGGIISDPSVDLTAQIGILVEELIADPNDARWQGGALQSKRDLESDIKLANDEFKRATNKIQGTRKLYKNDYVAFAELEADELAYSRAEIRLKQAQTTMDLFLKYDFRKETEKLISDYEEAQRQLQRTQASARAKLAQAEARLKSAEATYLLQKKQLERLREQLAACVMRATVPGMAVYGSSGDFFSRRDQMIELGGEVRERQRIITIPDTSTMAVEIQVHESWVDKVQVGQPAKITVDAFPDTIFTGRVHKVSLLPDSQRSWMDTGVKVYSTEVIIDGQHDSIRPGMSAKVEIQVRDLQDVLYIPIQAVANKDNQKFCYVEDSSGLEMRKVTVGEFNQNFINIISGLNEGEKVSLVPSRILTQENALETQEPFQDSPDEGGPVAGRPQGPPAMPGGPGAPGRGQWPPVMPGGAGAPDWSQGPPAGAPGRGQWPPATPGGGAGAPDWSQGPPAGAPGRGQWPPATPGGGAGAPDWSQGPPAGAPG
ncbi:MAG: efflux RND transporter periplasmic adaptor subunit, partial [Sedimentisphaerales bacterium]|nr:efflux RND transporter periplasmic adaptor subunit [Sedimentisphaerales bacterium]